jgi:hypothetical protein
MPFTLFSYIARLNLQSVGTMILFNIHLIYGHDINSSEPKFVQMAFKNYVAQRKHSALPLKYKLSNTL